MLKNKLYGIKEYINNVVFNEEKLNEYNVQ